jgi:hypothetical protein
MLKTISAKAITTNIDVNIFIADLFVRRKNTKKSSYINKPLTLLANNLTAIARSTIPNVFLITPNPFFPNIFSIFADDLSTI